MRRSLVLPAVVGLFIAGAPSSRAPGFARVYALKPDEGVFAYSRISPDGRYLAYSSEMPASNGGPSPTRIVNIVDLSNRKVVFTAPGIDGFFSTDGDRLIWLSGGGSGDVRIRNNRTGTITRSAAPVHLGDYFSWATRDARDLILTIKGNYYYLNGDKAILPPERVPPCPGIGPAERPLISKDGLRITTFVRGTVVVRNLTDCDFVFDTGIEGAKADFSWNGRYVAMHAPKPNGRGYHIKVVDLQQRTVRTVTEQLPGSAFFPSWTRDGRLSFRYDGEDYRGFMIASDILSAPATLLPVESPRKPARPEWGDVFPETPRPRGSVVLVMIWGPWSAHAPDALVDLERTRVYFQNRGASVRIAMATDPGSAEVDIARMLMQVRSRVPRIVLAPERLTVTEAYNQNPTTLLFHHDVLIDHRLGAQSFEELRDWVASHDGSK